MKASDPVYVFSFSMFLEHQKVFKLSVLTDFRFLEMLIPETIRQAFPSTPLSEGGKMGLIPLLQEQN